MNDPLGQALSGLTLLCAFALLPARQPSLMTALYRAQSALLTAAACWQGHTQHEAALYLTAAITFVLNVLALPRALQKSPAPPAKSALHPVITTALGVMLLGFASNAVPGRLEIPLAVLLLNLLLTASRRDVFAQTVGLLTVGNALLLTAITLPSLPFVPEIAAALAALATPPVFFLNSHGREPG